MSDIDISSGGSVAVDSTLVRGIGHRLRMLGRRLDEARDLLWRAAHTLEQAPHVNANIGTAGIIECARRIADVLPVVENIAHGCSVMADTFEVVELRTERDALAIGDPRALVLQARIDRIMASDPDMANRLEWIDAAWEKQRYAGTDDQALDVLAARLGESLIAMSSLAPAGLIAATGALGHFLRSRPVEGVLRAEIDLVRKFDRGDLAPGARLTGPAPQVGVQLVSAGSAVAPTGMKDALQRIPSGRQGQVVVEKYMMPDGTNRFMTYLDGTREVKPGTDEPWDMQSNWEMYMEHRTSASYEATMQALEAAGAEPGDRVDFVAYSQGAAVASFSAMDSVYDTKVVIAAGNPVTPHLRDDQTLALLEHDGDLVANLADGPQGGTGSADSFTVRRDVDRMLFTDEHDFEEYLKTGEMADAASDSRVRSMDGLLFDDLGEAVSVERMEFEAKRK